MDVKDSEIKQEVVAAYNEVLRKLKVVKSGLKEKTEEDIQEEKIREEEINIIDLASRETADELIKNLSEIKLQVSKTLDEIKAKLIPEYEKFATLRQAIELSKRQLKDNHGIEASANSLGVLLLAQKEKAAAFNQEIVEYRQAFENEKKTNEIERRNEMEEYLFKRDAARKKDEEHYKTLKDDLEQELIDRRRAFEEDCEAREARLAAREQEHNQLKEREAWIAAREQEYQHLKEKAAHYPDELRMSVQKAERILAEQLTRKYEYDTKLAQIDLESERKLYQQKITALEEQIEQYKTLKQLFAQSSFNREGG